MRTNTPTTINNDYTNVTKFMKITSNYIHNRQETKKNPERQKNSFPKELVENADIYKPV